MVETGVRVLLAVVVVCSLVGAASAAQAGAVGTATASTSSFDFAQIDADDVLLQVDLQEDGDARWTVEYRMRLDDENATAAFDSLQAEVESNPGNFTDRFGDRIRETARVAEEATGREMEIREVEVAAERRSLPQEYGVVVYTFEWTNFAAVDGETIRAGDALGGLFLDEETSLVVRWPEGYDLQRATPEPDETRERAAVWHGPVDFGPDEPRVVAGTPAGERTLPLAIGGVAAAVVLLVVTAGVVLLRRRGEGTNTEASGAADSGAADSGAADSGAADSGGADDSSDPGDLPDELLSNEERVLRLIERNGGRMKQQEVVQELGWTDAKTSQVVGDLRDEGKVDGFRLGRENVLRLPGEDEE